MKDFYLVHEFSVLSGIEVSKLKYWDEIGLFSPVKRNPENNFRYYSLVQLLALNFVDTLSKLNIPLKIIGDLRNDRDPEKFLAILEKKERELDMELRRVRESSSIIHARQKLIRSGIKTENSGLEEQISIMRIENDETFALWPKNEYKEGDTFLEPLTDFVRQTGEHHINLGFPVGGYYESIECFTATPNRPCNFISIDPTGLHKRKAGQYLTGFARGYYGDLGDLPQRMNAYAKENAVETKGPVYILYLFEETCIQDPSRYLAQCCIAVK